MKKSGRIRGRQAVAKQLPSAGHIPGKVVGLELQANTSFLPELTAEHAPQKVACLELQDSVSFGALNTQSDKRSTNLLHGTKAGGTKTLRSRGQTRR
eukprot:13275122-Heterocapsa_arctica.AAC.1